jgi:hypothetical protein
MADERDVTKARIQADPGPGDDAPVFTRDQLAEAWGVEPYQVEEP